MNHKNIIFRSVFTLALAGFLGACQDDLEDVNKNPNEAIIAQPDYVLANAIKSNADIILGSDASMETTTLYVQHWAKIHIRIQINIQPVLRISRMSGQTFTHSD